jgi:very-short-patch-repair endonuclease
MTPAECVLWEAVRGNRLAGLRFRRQQVIDGFIVDFYCHAARLVIEIDGGIHEAQQGHDIARDQILAGRALRVIRFTNDDVLNDLQDVLRQIVIAPDSLPNPV